MSCFSFAKRKGGYGDFMLLSRSLPQSGVILYSVVCHYLGKQKCKYRFWERPIANCYLGSSVYFFAFLGNYPMIAGTYKLSGGHVTGGHVMSFFNDSYSIVW